MSLVNDMLNELDQRQRLSTETGAVLGGLNTAEQAQERPQSSSALHSMTLVVALLGLAIAVNNVRWDSQDSTQGTSVVTPASQQTFEPASVPASQATIQLPARADFDLSVAAKAVVPEPVSAPASQFVADQQAFEREQAAMLPANETSSEKSPPAAPQPLPQADFARMDRTPARDPVREEYENATTLVRASKWSLALQSLDKVLSEDAAHVDARLLKLAVLREVADADSLAVLLAESHALFPEDARFAMPWAQLLVERGESGRALAVLQPAAPPVNKDPEYHAFMAALANRLGLSASAASAYEKALSIRSDHGQWWLGLGLALQGQQRRDEAAKALERALADPELPAELRRFARSRLVRASSTAGR